MDDDDLSDILPVLDPPAGGLERLRARLDQARPARRRRAPTLVALAAAALILVTWLTPPARPVPATSDPVLAALSTTPAEPVQVLSRSRLVAMRVETAAPGLVYYRVDGVAECCGYDPQ